MLLGYESFWRDDVQDVGEELRKQIGVRIVVEVGSDPIPAPQQPNLVVHPLLARLGSSLSSATSVA